jgi:hypothetical protein
VPFVEGNTTGPGHEGRKKRRKEGKGREAKILK